MEPKYRPKLPLAYISIPPMPVLTFFPPGTQLSLIYFTIKVPHDLSINLLILGC